jgi:hypothetical protein
MQRKRFMVLAGLALLLQLGILPIYSMPIPPDRVEEVLELFSGGFLPFEQVSVSLGDEAGSYSICWVSSIADTPSVQYMGQQFIGKTVTYQRASLKYPHYASGNIHKVLTHSHRSAIQTLAVHALPRSPPPSMSRFKSAASLTAATSHISLPSARHLIPSVLL